MAKCEPNKYNTLPLLARDVKLAQYYVIILRVDSVSESHPVSEGRLVHDDWQKKVNKKRSTWTTWGTTSYCSANILYRDDDSICGSTKKTGLLLFLFPTLPEPA